MTIIEIAMLTKHRKLKVKLLIVYLFSILPFLIFIFYLFDLWYDTRRAQVLEQNIIYANMAGEFINTTIKEGENISEIMAQDPYFMEVVSKMDKEKANLYLKSIIAKIPLINSINLFHPDGTPFASSSDLVTQQSEIKTSDRDYFQKTLETKKMVVSSMTIGRYSAKRLLIIASPVMNKDEISEIITVTLNIDVLKSSVEDILKKQNATNNSLILLDNQGQLVFVANQPYPKEEEINLLAENQCYQDAHNGKNYLLENKSLPFINKKVMGTCIPINHNGWVVGNVMPIEELYAPIFKIQKFIWVIIGSALLFAGGLFSFYLRKIRIVY